MWRNWFIKKSVNAFGETDLQENCEIVQEDSETKIWFTSIRPILCQKWNNRKA